LSALRHETTHASTHGEEHLGRIAAFFDEFAPDEQRWRRRNRAYYALIESNHRLMIPKGAKVLGIGSGSGDLLAALQPSRGIGVDVSPAMVDLARSRHPELEFSVGAGEDIVRGETFEYVILSDLVQFAYDLQHLLRNVRQMTGDGSRVVIYSYSQLWRPIIRLAELAGLKPRKPIQNWVTPGDLRNLLELAHFEVVSRARRILLPKQIPVLSTFVNGFVNVWPFSYLALTWWVVARPRPEGADRLGHRAVPQRGRDDRRDHRADAGPRFASSSREARATGPARRSNGRSRHIRSATSPCTSRPAPARAMPSGSAFARRSTSF
jgi:SAM-dependent methyltransferase